MPKTKSNQPRSKHTGRPLPAKSSRTPVPKHRVPSDEIPAQAAPVPKQGCRVMYRLGSIVTDLSTENEGMLTHLHIDLDLGRTYRFQPRGLSPEDGTPLKGSWIAVAAINGKDQVLEPELPLHILGTEVNDTASGFTGTAIAVVLHISGCVHVTVQPKGKHPKTGGAVEPCDFDIRRLEGVALTKMTEEERQKDQTEKPSPVETDRCEPRAPQL